jgi:hypothetical protein
MAVFAFGGLLLLVAILGGGFEVKELKVPTVGRASRLAACVCGILFVFMGIKLDGRLLPAKPAAPAPEARRSADSPVTVVLMAGPAGEFVVPQTFRPGSAEREWDGKVPVRSEGRAPQTFRPSTTEREPDREPSMRAETAVAQPDYSSPPAAARQARSTERTSGEKATAVSDEAPKRRAWKQKPRQWWKRIRGKSDDPSAR